MNRKDRRPGRGTVVKLLVGLLSVAVCCAGLGVGLAAYRDRGATDRPVAQVRAAVPVPARTTAPAAGTYWVCEPDVNASGAVDRSLDTRIKAEGGVISTVCEQPLQLEGILQAGSGGHAFQIPVGHFTPFHFCGITVANIVNTLPGNLDVPPSRWIAVNYLLFNADFTGSAPSGTC